MMRTRQIAAAVLFGLGLWSAPVSAECERSYTPPRLTHDLGTMSSSLRTLDEETFRTTGRRMEANLTCISQKLPMPVYASLYRYIGAYHYLEKDYQVAGRWFRAALELDPTYEWDVNDLGPSHPLRTTFEAQRSAAATEPVVIDKVQINPPVGTELVLDGRTMREPALTEGRPHLLQVVSLSDQSVVEAVMIDGADFPDRFLTSAAPDPVALEEPGRNRRDRNKKPSVVETDEIAYGDVRVVTVQRSRPAAKTPMLIAGGAGLLIGGGLYAASFTTRAQFNSASTTDDLLQAQTLTNTLVIASGSMLAVGVGVGYAGVMMGDSPGVFFGRRF
ncbi:MAG: tetratricopeptide repeat protein [Myxococcota bacterium]